VSVPAPAHRYYQLTGHVVLRFASAHLLDPVTTVLRMQEDLAASRPVSTREAAAIVGHPMWARNGRTLRAGAHGIYVCEGNCVVTYIDNCPRFKQAEVRGIPQASRGCRLKSAPARRKIRE